METLGFFIDCKGMLGPYITKLLFKCNRLDIVASSL
jgi:hypothetical protein